LLIVTGLAGRSALDKLLMLKGGAELVGRWAQVFSICEIVGGVVAAGVGAGLVVQVAREKGRESAAHLDEALAIGLLAALPVALAMGSISWILSDFLSGGAIAPWIFAIAAASGFVGVVPLLLGNYWLGQRNYGPMLWMAAAQAVGMLAAAFLAPIESSLGWIVVMQASPAIAFIFVRRGAMDRRRPRSGPHPLRRYILPGLSIGILGPLSLLLVRSLVGDALSWHEAGVMQALFRLSDWVCTFAGGFLSLFYLVRFAASGSEPALRSEMKSAVLKVFLPSAAALGLMLLLHRPLLAALYDPSLQASHTAAALFFTGSLVRIGSWIPLFALYAQRRTRQIALGELLSLPLFALLVYGAGNSLSLELAGAFWLLAYCAYAAFNLRAARLGT
jgi:O-antigen/teichoic acid export membrane protein